MTVEAWLAAAIADAERRGLPELKPLLETLARSTAALRRAESGRAGRRRAGGRGTAMTSGLDGRRIADVASLLRNAQHLGDRARPRRARAGPRTAAT